MKNVRTQRLASLLQRSVDAIASRAGGRAARPQAGCRERVEIAPGIAEWLEQRIVLSSATHLAFAQGPANVLPGSTFPLLTVDVEDAGNNVVATDSSTVTLTLSAGGMFAGGGGAVAAQAVNGIATFAGLSMNVDGSFTLAASDNLLTGVTSAPFTVSGYALQSGAPVVTYPYGASPEGTLAIDTSGNLFGTTAEGGADGDGVVFEIAKGSSTSTTIASFNGANGADPVAAVTLDTDGNLFGTTSFGGSNGRGTVFEIAKGINNITELASFNSSLGTESLAAVTCDANGNLFGTTESGGADAEGTIFEIANGSDSITTLANFNGDNGEEPVGAVTFDTSGNLFGTTTRGGPNYDVDGTVFEVARGSSNITTLAVFDGTNGEDPMGAVTFDTSGNLFGTTSEGGAYGQGEIFEIPQGSSTIATVAAFNVTVGSDPQAAVSFDSQGNLFGSTTGGGANDDGTVFEIAKGNSTLTTLASFSGANTSNNAVTLDNSGNIFGTIANGGANDDGTAFEIAKGSGAITTFASFNSINGDFPQGAVTFDTSGNLFGTTNIGGASGDGTVFEVARGSSTLTTVLSFSGSNGSFPQGALTFDSIGDLFGTTDSGGPGNNGTVFEIAKASGNLTTLATFNGSNGAYPEAGVILDASGDLFGTTESGGAVGSGTVFEITKGSGIVTTLVNFDIWNTYSTSNGAYPVAPVIFDSSGNLFGTTSAGGANGCGTVFEIAKGSGALTTLATFMVSNGENPEAAVTFDSSGDLFGTTEGANSSAVWGTVFEIAKGSGTLTTISSFNGTDGGNPKAAVTFDTSGNLFGTTSGGGADGYGTVFEIAKGSNSLSTLASFNGTDGEAPEAAVALDTSGNLFGTTYNGGAAGDGALFELAKATQLAYTDAPASTTAGVALGGSDGIQVTLQDASGSTVEDGSTVTLTLTGGAFVGGAKTISTEAINGVATFNDLAISANGNYTLTASDGTLASASTSFSIGAITTTTINAMGPNPSIPTEAVTANVTVTGSVPDGETISLEDTSNGNAVVGTGTIASGSATVIIPAGSWTAGSHSIVAVYSGDSSFAGSTSSAVVQSVVKATPTSVSVGSVNIVYGTALANSQLIGSASVPGGFTYTSSAGLTLGAEAGQAEAVTFTPTDTIDYNTVSSTVTVNVAKAALAPTLIAANKVYNGTTADPGASITLAGIVGSDAVTASGTIAFASANVGNGITVTATGITLSGASASNYILSSTTAAATANITSSGSSSGSYDFGTATSPVATGYTQVTPATVFTSGVGYGWLAGANPILGFDTGITKAFGSLPTSMTRDFDYTLGGTFQVTVADGFYDVTLVLGDARAYSYTQNIAFGGTAVGAVATNSANAVVSKTYLVSVTNGLLDVGLSGSTSKTYAVIDGMSFLPDAFAVASSSPAAASTVTAAPTKMTVTFNHPLGAGAAVAGNYALTGASTVSIASATVSGETVTLTFASAITATGAYTLTIGAGVQDAAGGALAGASTIGFTYSAATIPLEYDFGTAASPVATGWTQVTNATSFSTALGYGWTNASAVVSYDTGITKYTSPDPNVTRDFNYTHGDTFAVDLANGTYTVTLVLGDARDYAYNMNVSLEGAAATAVDTTTAQPIVTKVYTVVVVNNQLTVNIGGAGSSWGVIDGLSIAP